jgi:C-terminal processing protease CtpA/Prc
MPRGILALLCAVLTLPGLAQTAPSTEPGLSNFDQAISFEGDAPGSSPNGWHANPPGTVVVDRDIFHSGRRSVRIERNPDSPGSFSALTKVLSLDVSGSVIELRAFICTAAVSEFAGVWMREDKDGDVLELENMQKRQLKGTTKWTEYSITLPIDPGAQKLYFGALMAGTGKAWFDDLQLFVDGKPVSQARRADHPLDAGSGIVVSSPTQMQIDNLFLLGKVWGFLKYHHPLVTSGHLPWDAELFHIMPAILAASNHAAAQTALLHWIEKLGPLPPCDPCAPASKGEPQALGPGPAHSAVIAVRPDLAWISDEALVGRDLAKTLQVIQQKRPVDQQFYVSFVGTVKNPHFEAELKYTAIKLPDAAFQILALYRFWNIIEYWYPYRNIVGEDWDGVLRQFLPRMALATSSDEYRRELIALIALVHDTHANLWSSLRLRPPVGECRLPINLRFIGQRPVITGLATSEEDNHFKPGDVLIDLDGQSVSKLVEAWSPYYAASNQAARLRDIARTLTNGACGPITVTVLRGSESLTIQAKRGPAAEMTAAGSPHDQPGSTFRLLSGEVAYLKLSSVKIADVDHYLELAANTKGLIVDIRNYPSEFVVFKLGSHFFDQVTPFARFTYGDLSNPGTFDWSDPESIEPAAPHYSGKVVILVDENSQSQAEYTAMAFRASPHAMVIGSTTAGADGNVSTIPLPGGLNATISGIGVFYPDGRPTQQIGIVPDERVVPTTDGIRDGRDEVLEEAVRQITGPGILGGVTNR